ncbi:MAG: HEAT repeat domain-containing protein [Planctomycetota bacterium]|jgi:HEAT repeat protein
MNTGTRSAFILITAVLFGCVGTPSRPLPPPDPRTDPTVQLEGERVSKQHMKIPVLMRDKDVSGLLQLLSDPDASVVSAAAEALITLDNPAAASYLEKRLDEVITSVLLEIEKGVQPQPHPVHSLTFAVTHFTRPESAYVLSRVVRLPFAKVRAEAVKGIRLSRNPDRFLYLQNAFDTVTAAGKAADTEAEAELPEYSIIDAIGRIRTPAALDFLMKILQHNRADLRLHAGRALAPYHDLFPDRFDPLRFRITDKPREDNK